jgi:hypothetical protein
MRKILCLLLLSLAGCAHREVDEQVAFNGNRTMVFKRIGTEFVNAENDRFVVTEAGLTTYRTNGKNFVRWQFSIRPKQPTQLASVQVEDVTGSHPYLVILDRSPKIEELAWTQRGPLLRATSTELPWLFDPSESTRVFRITVTESDGTRSTLYQATAYTLNAKKKFRMLMGPELQQLPPS